MRTCDRYQAGAPILGRSEGVLLDLAVGQMVWNYHNTAKWVGGQMNNFFLALVPLMYLCLTSFIVRTVSARWAPYLAENQ